MDSMREGEISRAGNAEGGRPEQFVCDFCGQTVHRVRRIAIDRDYERLQTPHRVQYACETCSDQKEKHRLGIDRG
jgi:hypothetical protein